MATFRGILLGLFLAGAAAPASAATLPFTATLTVGFGTLPPIVLTASGIGVSNGGGMMFTVPSGLFATTRTFTGLNSTILQPSQVTVKLYSNLQGVFNPSFAPAIAHTPTVGLLGKNLTLPAAPPGTGVGGAMPLVGNATVWALGFPLIMLPFTVGAGTTTVMAANGAIYATVFPTFWSTGYGFGIYTPGSMTVSYFVITGSDTRTPGGAGRITLVTPIVANVSVGGTPSDTGIRIMLSVNFIPEPGTGLLVGAGIVGLALAGRRRRRAG